MPETQPTGQLREVLACAVTPIDNNSSNPEENTASLNAVESHRKGPDVEEFMRKGRLVERTAFAVAIAVALGTAFLLIIALGHRDVASAESITDDAISGEVMVQFQEMVSLAKARDFLSEQGYKVIGEIKNSQVVLLKVPDGQEIQAIRDLQSNPLVKYAEPNYIIRACAEPSLSPAVPNDTYWSKQWNMRKIEAPTAWSVVTGTPQIVVGIIDSGIDDLHPEFQGRILPGYDYVNHDNDPYDDFWHGTHVAGILAAMGNNGIGVAGVAWGVRIRAYKVLDETGEGSYFNLASAIYGAIDDGVRVLNISLGGNEDSDIVREAVRKAHDAGILLVAAVGNDDRRGVYYPAAFPEVLAVAATGADDDRAPYSDYGDEVDLAAPGGDGTPIISTVPNGLYSGAVGTSMATPHVSGAAALLMSLRPDLTNDEVADILKETCDKVGLYVYDSNGWNQYLGYGRINLSRALRRLLPPRVDDLPDSIYFLTNHTNQPIYKRVLLKNESHIYAIPWEATVRGGTGWLALTVPISRTIGPDESQGLTVTMTSNDLPFGVYSGTVTISSPYSDVQGLPHTISVTLQYTSAEIQQYYMPYFPASPPLNVYDEQNIALGDDEYQKLDLPFPVHLPGERKKYTRVWVASNGFVTFRPPAASRAPYRISCESAEHMPATVYVLGDDLDPSAGGRVTAFLGENTVEIQWRDVPFFQSNEEASFRLIFRRDGTIEAIYDSMPDRQRYPTVGVIGTDGTPIGRLTCPGRGRAPSSGQTIRWR